mgnify:CR=1 FL=1
MLKIEALYTLKVGDETIPRGVYSDATKKGIPEVVKSEAKRGARTVRVLRGEKELFGKTSSKKPPKEEPAEEEEVVTTQDTGEDTVETEGEEQQPASSSSSSRRKKTSKKTS